MIAQRYIWFFSLPIVQHRVMTTNRSLTTENQIKGLAGVQSCNWRQAYEYY